MVERLACQCKRVRSTGCRTLLEEEEGGEGESAEIKEHDWKDHGVRRGKVKRRGHGSAAQDVRRRQT